MELHCMSRVAKLGKDFCFFFVNMSFVDLMQYFSILNEIEIYVKSQVLEKMREKGVAESDMKPSDVDLEKDYVSSESRFVFTPIRATVLLLKAGLKKLKIKRFILTSIRRLFCQPCLEPALLVGFIWDIRSPGRWDVALSTKTTDVQKYFPSL